MILLNSNQTKKSIGMLAVWLFAPEPEIREV